jgi:hypothetical protein
MIINVYEYDEIFVCVCVRVHYFTTPSVDYAYTLEMLG